MKGATIKMDREFALSVNGDELERALLPGRAIYEVNAEIIGTAVKEVLGCFVSSDITLRTVPHINTHMTVQVHGWANL